MSSQTAPPGGTNQSPHNNPYGIQLFPVKTPSGAELNLMSAEEADYYEERRNLYLTHNKFTNISDLQDVDRVLTFEIMVFRWSTWLTQGFDYLMARVDEHALKGNIKDYSTELRLLKATLGLDKATRDKDKGEDIATYLQTLLRRAKQFGIHRNNQYEHAVTLMFDIRTMVETYKRSDKEEREQLDLSPESIVEWISDNIVDKWDEIDEAFRKEQRIWVHEL